MLEKIVDIFIKVKYDYTVHRGNGVILYRYNGRIKTTYFCTIELTCNRAILVAAINAIDSLKEPCQVNLYLQTNIGFKFLENSKKWINRDLGNHLLKIIRQGNHIVNLIDCSFHEKGKIYQSALEKKLYKKTTE